MSDVMRVLQVIGRMNRGGAETMIMNIYRNIDRNKVQFDFMVHTKEKGAYDEEILSLGGKIYYAPKFNGLNFIQYRKFWSGFFKEHTEHSIVHGHIGSSAALYLSVAKRYRKFTIAHSHATNDTSKNIKVFLWRLYSYPTRNIADYFFCCSKRAGIDRYGKKTINSLNCNILNNAIDTKQYIFLSMKREKIRKELCIENKFVIGHVGRFNEVKNHNFLIEVFKKVYERNKNSVLLLVGDGKLKSEIQRKVKNLGIQNNVIFTGIREDIPELLMAMDVFVFPSHYEGLGIVAIEAQASGLHTICSDVLPQEAKVTNLLEYISLSKSADEWAQCVLKYNNSYERRNEYEDIGKARYDIAQTVSWLESFYLSHG